MLERGRELDLPVEPLSVDPRRELGRQDLHYDAPPEPDFLGDEHPAHAAAAELPLHTVRGAEGGLETLAEVGGHGSTKIA